MQRTTGYMTPATRVIGRSGRSGPWRVLYVFGLRFLELSDADASQVSLYTFVSPLASSMMAPGLPEIAQKYSITNETVVALTLSIFLLTFAIGPLFLAPLSEIYGRTWVCTASISKCDFDQSITSLYRYFTSGTYCSWCSILRARSRLIPVCSSACVSCVCGYCLEPPPYTQL